MRQRQFTAQTKIYSTQEERQQLGFAAKVLNTTNSELIRQAIAGYYRQALQVQAQQQRQQELQAASLFEVVEPGVVVTGAYGA